MVPAYLKNFSYLSKVFNPRIDRYTRLQKLQSKFLSVDVWNHRSQFHMFSKENLSFFVCVCEGKKSFSAKTSFKNIPMQTIKYLRANSSANYSISDLIWRTRPHSCDWENTQGLHRVKYAKNFGGDRNRSSFILPIHRATVDRKALRSHSKRPPARRTECVHRHGFVAKKMNLGLLHETLQRIFKGKERGMLQRDVYHNERRLCAAACRQELVCVSFSIALAMP